MFLIRIEGMLPQIKKNSDKGLNYQNLEAQ